MKQNSKNYAYLSIWNTIDDNVKLSSSISVFKILKDTRG